MSTSEVLIYSSATVSPVLPQQERVSLKPMQELLCLNLRHVGTLIMAFC